MIDHFQGFSGFRQECWTLIYVADDGTSPQMVLGTGLDPESAARSADQSHPWLADFRLVAALPGEPEVYLADDARTGERGLLKP